MSLDEAVKQVINKQFSQFGSLDCKSTDSLVDDLGADSLDQVELMMAMEEHFDIRISDDEAAQVVSVQDLIDLVQRKMVGFDGW